MKESGRGRTKGAETRQFLDAEEEVDPRAVRKIRTHFSLPSILDDHRDVLHLVLHFVGFELRLLSQEPLHLRLLLLRRSHHLRRLKTLVRELGAHQSPNEDLLDHSEDLRGCSIGVEGTGEFERDRPPRRSKKFTLEVEARPEVDQAKCRDSIPMFGPGRSK